MPPSPLRSAPPLCSLHHHRVQPPPSPTTPPAAAPSALTVYTSTNTKSNYIPSLNFFLFESNACVRNLAASFAFKTLSSAA